MADARGEKDKRSLIMEAAVTVFSQHGFHQTKVEDVAVAAGIGKGTIYEYFSSKRELFEEMFKNCLRLYGDKVQQELANEPTVRGKLARLLQLHLEFTQMHRDLAKVTFGDHSWISPAMQEWMLAARREKISYLRGIIEEGIKQGEFRQINPEAAGLVITGSISALWFPDGFGDGLEFAQLLDSLNDILFNGLSA